MQQERADRWCVEVAKAGLQERVAAQAAAEVQLEGRADRLQLRCTQQSHTIAVRMQRRGCDRPGVASQVDARIRLRYAEMSGPWFRRDWVIMGAWHKRSLPPCQ